MCVPYPDITRVFPVLQARAPGSMGKGQIFQDNREKSKLWEFVTAMMNARFLLRLQAMWDMMPLCVSLTRHGRGSCPCFSEESDPWYRGCYRTCIAISLSQARRVDGGVAPRSAGTGDEVEQQRGEL
jgi:hypothetical protein